MPVNQNKEIVGNIFKCFSNSTPATNEVVTIDDDCEEKYNEKSTASKQDDTLATRNGSLEKLEKRFQHRSKSWITGEASSTDVIVISSDDDQNESDEDCDGTNFKTVSNLANLSFLKMVNNFDIDINNNCRIVGISDEGEGPSGRKMGGTLPSITSTFKRVQPYQFQPITFFQYFSASALMVIKYELLFALSVYRFLILATKSRFEDTESEFISSSSVVLLNNAILYQYSTGL